LRKFNPYRNLFYYYRGSTSGQKQFEKQLEDNTTKALINTIEFTSNSLLFLFLSALNIPIKNKYKPNYDLQVSGEFSRPDALITLGKSNIFIESKIDASLDLKQIKKHLKSIDDDYLVCITPREKDSLKLRSINYSKLRFITWQKIYEVFSAYTTSHGRKNNNLVLNQYLKYLESINMAPFNGFQKEDFDSFLHIEDDPKREIRSIVKNKFKKYLEELYGELKKDKLFKKLDYSIGNLRQDSKAVWGIICKRPMNNKVQKPQFHFSLDRNCFRIGIMVEGKKPAKRMNKKIMTSPQSFYKIIKKLNGFVLEIKNKVNIDNIPKKFKHYPVATIKLGKEIMMEDVDYIANKVSHYNLFMFYCYKEIPRDDKMLQSKRFINASKKFLTQTVPYYMFADEDSVL